MRPLVFKVFAMNDFDKTFGSALHDLMDHFGDPIVFHPQGGADVVKNVRGEDLRGEYRDGGHDVDDGESAVRVAMKSLEVNQQDLPDGCRYRLGDFVTHNGIKYELSEELARADQMYRFSLKRVRP